MIWAIPILPQFLKYKHFSGKDKNSSYRLYVSIIILYTIEHECIRHAVFWYSYSVMFGYLQTTYRFIERFRHGLPMITVCFLLHFVHSMRTCSNVSGRARFGCLIEAPTNATHNNRNHIPLTDFVVHNRNSRRKTVVQTSAGKQIKSSVCRTRPQTIIYHIPAYHVHTYMIVLGKRCETMHIIHYHKCPSRGYDNIVFYYSKDDCSDGI